MSNLKWTFPERGLQDSEEAFDGTLSSFDGKLGSILREAIQNSADAKWPIFENNNNVEIKVSIIKLTGSFKNNFLNAMAWESLEQHLTAVADSKNISAMSLPNKIKNGLKNIKNGSLYLLKIEDFNTSGLFGTEIRNDSDEINNRNAYAAALFSTGISQKGSSGSGGSYGMGKFALMKGSMIQTIIYNSCINTKPSNFEQNSKLINLKDLTEGKSKNRLIGKISLGDHKVGDTKFDKQGWFGETEVREKKVNIDGEININKEKVAISSWTDESFVEKLYLSRNGKPGTSVLIVGYDPSEDFGIYERDIEDIVHEVKKTISINFWPAMAKDDKQNGKLEISVGAFENNKPVQNFQKIEPKDYVPHHVLLFKHFEEKLKNPVIEIPNTKELKNIGDKVARVVEVEIPKTKPKNEIGESYHDKVDHDIAVLVQYVDKNEQIDSDLINTVALIRSAGMVVKYDFGENNRTNGYKKISNYGKDFIAIAIAGTFAQNPDLEYDAKIADIFYKNCEPPHHDSWTNDTEAFRALYPKRGPKKLLLDGLNKISSVVSALLKEERNITSNIPIEMRKDLSIPAEGTIVDPPPSHPGFRLSLKNTEFNSKTLTYNLSTKLIAPKDLEGTVKVEIGVSESSIQGNKRSLPFEIKKTSIKGKGGKLLENNILQIDSNLLAKSHRSISFEIQVNTKSVGINPFNIGIELDKPIVLEGN